VSIAQHLGDPIEQFGDDAHRPTPAGRVDVTGGVAALDQPPVALGEQGEFVTDDATPEQFRRVPLGHHAAEHRA